MSLRQEKSFVEHRISENEYKWQSLPFDYIFELGTPMDIHTLKDIQ